ncbi:MAG: ATP-binding cassette domain-containing protein [Hyphomicrobiaceae bacterium]|nr:ATP-binding cassette domain-containing protein [Hyphomicrobiaceae bacterium]
MTPVLAARGVTKSFGAHRALQDATLDVAAGEFIGVLGPSGSGKTTLFRCLTRLSEPDAGSIRIDGVELVGLRGRALARARRRIGIVFQQFNLVGRLSALDNVLAGRLAEAPVWRVLARRFHDDDVRCAVSALQAVGLAEHLHQRADTLSGGQQQRVAIARALAQESRVLLADEPVASLDPATAIATLDLLHSIARSTGLAVLCTLHQPDLARRYADRILMMQDGRLAPATATLPEPQRTR